MGVVRSVVGGGEVDVRLLRCWCRGGVRLPVCVGPSVGFGMWVLGGIVAREGRWVQRGEKMSWTGNDVEGESRSNTVDVNDHKVDYPRKYFLLLVYILYPWSVRGMGENIEWPCGSVSTEG